MLALFSSCKKDFLNTKPDKALLVPTTIGDMQALLDNIAVFNITPGITTIADGDFYTTDAGWKAWSSETERTSYLWAADIWGTFNPSDWLVPHQQIFYANVVLDALPNIDAKTAGYGAIKGTALFSRAFAYYNLLQEFANPYRAASSGTDPGLSVRLTADINQKPPRSSLRATFDQVIADLRAARALLPLTSNYKSRPVLAAAYGLLARVYLVTGDYALAGKYADSCLQQRPVLIDYNTLSATATRPFPRAIPNGNDEVIYYASQVSFSSAGNAATLADSTLFRSYVANDLRKTLFFRASGISGTFKGNYAGIIALFSGIAADEMYLVRAECAARLGQAGPAIDDLNTMLLKRWKKGTYVPLVASDAESALKLVLAERRKELIGRTMRWSDLKRLNNDPRFALTLTHKVNGQVYTLAPDSKRYAYPLPLDEVNLGGVVQNER